MKIHHWHLALGALAAITSTVAQASSVVDIPKIAGQSMKQVGGMA